MVEDYHGDDYGHEGPIVANSYEKRGETVEVWICRACNCSVPRENPELLADANCENYQDVSEAL